MAEFNEDQENRLVPIDPYGMNWKWDLNQPIRILAKRNPWNDKTHREHRECWKSLKPGMTIAEFISADEGAYGIHHAVLHFGIFRGLLAIGDYVDQRFGRAL